MRRTLLIALAAVVGLAVLAGPGCRRVRIEDTDYYRNESRSGSDEDTTSIALEGAERLDARIRMGVGELRLSSADTSEAITTDFEYNRKSWQPEVSYEINGDTGAFDIEQPDSGGLRGLWRDGGFGRDIRYRWDIGLPKGVPTDLQLDFGVGDAQVALGGLALEELRVNAGVGDMTIDLSGDWAQDLDAHIQAGVGTVTLKVPNGVGVRVSGRQDGLGDFEAQGMRIDGNAYVNDAYGTSPVTLDIDLQRGVGDVTIELVD